MDKCSLSSSPSLYQDEKKGTCAGNISDLSDHSANMIVVEDLKVDRAAAPTPVITVGPPKSGGVGYGSRRDAYSAFSSTDDVKTFKTAGEADSDIMIAQTIDRIHRELTPGPRKTTIFDTLILNLFWHSLFFDSVVSLIRNDSVDNITEREVLYEKLFTLLHLLASQEELCKILICPRPNMKNSPGLWGICDAWSPSNDIEKLLPPILCSFENTYKQALIFIALAEKHSGAGSK